VPAAPTASRKMPEELRSRHLIVRVAEIAVFVALVVIAISSLPGLDEVRRRLQDTDPVWIVALTLAEIGSCGGYVLVFRATFCPQMQWGLSYDIAMAEQAANSLLPAGGAGGLALGAWALHQAGMPTGHIARRTVAFFLVTSAANFFALIVFGLGVFLGVIPGYDSPVLTLVPALIAVLAILLVVYSRHLLRAVGERGENSDITGGRRAWRWLRHSLSAMADGVDQAIALLRGHSFGIVGGSLAYMAFDIAALACGFAAVGHVPAVGTLVLGYLIGQLGNLIPLPGGIGGTEGALIGIFALMNANVSDATAAVLVYRLFQLAVPTLLGTPAFVLLRRRLLRADRPAQMCAPLASDAVQVVELPAPG
jgi:uncharacterized protein (TIRG00374 family)